MIQQVRAARGACNSAAAFICLPAVSPSTRIKAGTRRGTSSEGPSAQGWATGGQLLYRCYSGYNGLDLATLVIKDHVT